MSAKLVTLDSDSLFKLFCVTFFAGFLAVVFGGLVVMFCSVQYSKYQAREAIKQLDHELSNQLTKPQNRLP